MVGRLDPIYLAEIRNNPLVYKHISQPLKSLVITFSGGTPSKDKKEYWNGNIYWASPKDFKKFYINETEDTITETGVKNSSAKIAPKNSLLVVVRSGILQHTIPVAINTLPMAINQDVKVLMPNNSVLPEYLGYFFVAFNNKILSRIVKHSTTVQSINTFEFERLLIPVPAPSIQQQIIKIMDTAYEEKQQKEQQATDLLNSINSYLLDELGIAMLQEEENTLANRMFFVGSNKVLGGRFDPFYHKPIFEENLQNIKNCKNGTVLLRNAIIGNLTKGVLPSDSQKDGVFKVVQITNINADGSINTSSNITAKPIYLPKHKLQAGDTLVVITGATIGKIGFWDYEGDYYLGGDIVKFNTGNYRLNEIYAALLRTTPYQLQIKRCITGATNGHLAPRDLELLTMPLINDKKIQEKIANKLAYIRTEVKKLEQQASDIVDFAKTQVEKILLEGSL